MLRDVAVGLLVASVELELIEFDIYRTCRKQPTYIAGLKIRWRGLSGAWTLSGAPLSMSLSGVCLCACLLSDGGMISDEGSEL